MDDATIADELWYKELSDKDKERLNRLYNLAREKDKKQYDEDDLASARSQGYNEGFDEGEEKGRRDMKKELKDKTSRMVGDLLEKIF